MQHQITDVTFCSPLNIRALKKVLLPCEYTCFFFVIARDFAIQSDGGWGWGCQFVQANKLKIGKTSKFTVKYAFNVH